MGGRFLGIAGIAIAASFAMSGMVQAQSVTKFEENHQLIRGAEAPTAHGADLFGDRVSLYKGGLEFVQTDISLPGNHALPVTLARRMPTGSRGLYGRLFGDWDLDIPAIKGVFPAATGWRVTGTTAAQQGMRCTRFDTELAPSVLPGRMVYEPGFASVQLSVPGHGEQDLLVRSPAYGMAPTSGGPFPVVTKEGWQLACLPTLAGGTDAAGEGFLARAPDGTSYRFDWIASRSVPSLQLPAHTYNRQSAVPLAGAPSGNTPAGGNLPADSPSNVTIEIPIVQRIEIWLMPTLVTDRFGNTVRYVYSPQRPWQLLSIEASDGRRLTLRYGADNTSPTVTSASDGLRTWTYDYDKTQFSWPLTTVQLPDGSAWRFSGQSLQTPAGAVTRTMQHPSGAVGRFSMAGKKFSRSFVSLATQSYYGPDIVDFDAQVLTSKRLSGPGLGEATWLYEYSAAKGGYLPCAGCDSTRSTTVTDPRGYQTRHVFGMRWRDNEGLLLQTDEGWNGSTAVRTTVHEYRAAGAGPYPAEFGYSHNFAGDGMVNARHRPEVRRTITQQGTTFSWEVNKFDSLARPVSVSRIGPSGVRSETTAYEDNTLAWVLGQVKSVTDQFSGKVSEAHTYHPVTAMRTESRSFGLRTGKWQYHADGTIQAAFDLADRATWYSNYKRGLAQQITYPDGTGESAVVDDIGQVRSHTNPAGSTSFYGYDAMGRLASITPPGGDYLAYHPTTLSFAPSPGPAAGLEAGHWQQVIITGDKRTENYFDALWRLRLTRTWDTNDRGITERAVQHSYDIEGRKTFTSYPQRSIADIHTRVAGNAWAHDALGRVFKHYQDSELGTLETTTEYLPNFLRRVTNPRGHSTTYAFQNWDKPSEDAITSIWAPENVTVTIDRDTFGKARSITRGGNGVSATRSYAYDQHERLCKTTEPETGATAQAYDAAGNLWWRASGLNVPSTGCEQSAPGERTVSFGYDNRNRLISTHFGDGAPGIGRSYTADGLLESTWSGGSTWTYTYNNRRLLRTETLNFVGMTWAFGWTPDAYGNTTGLTYPDGTSVWYSANALGEPSQLSGYAHSIRYHPNGAVASYTLNNGVTHSVGQNTRGLPAAWHDSGVANDGYAYDQNGNVLSINDGQLGQHRSMGYDALDRLLVANGPWGAGSYQYDTVDNIVSSTVGSRSLTHHINRDNNRLTALSGSQGVGLNYDANGNVTNRGGQGYTFDIGNRLTSAVGKATYSYDGHGRRTALWFSNGDWRLQGYSQGGKLLYSRQGAPGGQRHVYLGDKLIAETFSGSAQTVYVHTDVLGSPVARTDATGQVVAGSRTVYEAYGATAAGASPNGIGFTGHVNDPDTGLVYMQQRYYDPIAGRFLSVDPVTTDAKSGGHFNRYSYGDNNPYKYTDPDGRSPKLLVDFGLNVALNVLTTGELGLASAAKETLVGAVNPAKTLQTAAKLGGAIGKAVTKEITLSQKVHGEAAKHAADAIKAGKPAELTIDRAGAAANRQASTGGLDKVPGKHLDEYPPAMFREGGADASVRAISGRDNMSAGACIGNACRGLPDGSVVRIKVGE